MALQKQPVTINFAAGLDTKSDKNQLQIGKFLTLINSVFDTAGRLTKRNGFANITTLPNEDQTTLTTLNDSLLATGTDLLAYSPQTNSWNNQGTIQPVGLTTQSIVRDSNNQYGPDSAVASNGLVCTVYSNSGVGPYYQIADITTGQQIINKVFLTEDAYDPRVFVLGRYFIVTYLITITAVIHLYYIAIPITMPDSPATALAIGTVDDSFSTTAYDGIVANNSLYLSWIGASTTVKINSLSSTLILQSEVSIAASTAEYLSVTADNSAATPIIWISFWDSGSNNGFSAAYDAQLNQLLAPTQIITNETLVKLTSIAINGVCTVFYEIDNDYASPYVTSNVQSDYIKTVTVTNAGLVGTPAVLLRSVGLASKPFYGTDSKTYLLVAYGEVNQPTYFLIDSLGNIYARIAYQNGGSYLNLATQVLPSVYSYNGKYITSYLIKDSLTTINKTTNSSNPVNAIYTQTGVNLAEFTINTSGQFTSEIANTLHLTGGQLWQYDSVRPVEHGFHVWPENVSGETTGSGSVGAGTYYYQFCYEWTDNEGNLHRSAPSIPFKIIVSSPGATALYVPMLRLTYKNDLNPVRIVGYRWSLAQQTYYQFTSIGQPELNDPTMDYATITDSSSDAAILGNTILYTTGGVIENIAAPASIHSCLYKNRLVLIDAEDPNLLWYSKQVIEGVPVEMSDLFTIFIAPTTGAQGSTGPCRAVSAMDDKLIIFKSNAIYYVTGNGPDNTGASNDFSDPIFITSSVGCSNPSSIVLMPNGLMFQSEKGIWLLGRDLQTVYVGADVESFNSETVLKAESIPSTNQVRFIISNGVTLLYDYFYQQWGTFTNIRAISSTLYQNKHTYINSFGQVFQEAQGTYVDGSRPVLMSFQTGPISLAGLRGYERFYFMFLLGTYYSPFKLNIGLSYDYKTTPEQTVMVTPDNFVEPWGDEQLWGSNGPWGGPGNVFQARIFPARQKCQTFNISVQEVYDASLGQVPGQGLTLSGINAVVGVKKGYSVQKAGRSFG